MNTIWWVRRDMRLHDNAALHAASRTGTPIPVFVLDEQVFCQNSDADRAEISLTPAFVSYTAETSATNNLHRSVKICR